MPLPRGPRCCQQPTKPSSSESILSPISTARVLLNPHTRYQRECDASCIVLELRPPADIVTILFSNASDPHHHELISTVTVTKVHRRMQVRVRHGHGYGRSTDEHCCTGMTAVTATRTVTAKFCSIMIMMMILNLNLNFIMMYFRVRPSLRLFESSLGRASGSS
jgi:hypothetical protein